MMFKIKQTNCLFVNFEKKNKKNNEIGNISFFLNNNKYHICGISLSDNKEFMCYECHICGINLSDNIVPLFNQILSDVGLPELYTFRQCLLISAAAGVSTKFLMPYIFLIPYHKCHICGINLSDNEEFMCYECHICGISLSDNEFMCYECHI
jgi:hypothetical protein